MRVTNHMVTSSSLRNMQKAMQKVSTLNEQVTTGKKISAPSEDPVIAIRALKLRTTCDQLEQYKKKNIPDALSWLDTTETSIENIEKRLSSVYSYCTQGAHDTFLEEDRSKIVNELRSLKEAIYAEGGTTYAGRYLFSGYKTETNLIFQDAAAKEGLSYNINEDISPAKIKPKNVVLNEVNADSIDDILAGSAAYNSPISNSAYVLKLAYDNIDSAGFSVNPATPVPPAALKNYIRVTDADGNEVSLAGVTVNTKAVKDAATYYSVADDEINFIPETGEFVFGKNVYDKIKNAGNISVNYDKSQFEVGDLRPEMYFNCTQTKTTPDGDKTVDFTVDETGQNIKYEVSFNQYITVNAQGKDIIKHDMGNCIEDMANAVQDVLDIENTITKLKEMLEDPKYKGVESAEKQINKMLEDADVELAMKRENMQKLFGNNMSNFQNYMDDVSAVQARVGTTVSKLELIQTRVTEQKDNFDELKSLNEDVETEEAAIDLYQSELVYESSLATTSNVIKKTLLDYL